MTEMDTFLNTRCMQVQHAVLCVGSGYQASWLKELVDNTNLKTLIITGYLSETQADQLMEDLLIRAQCGKQRLPEKFGFCPLSKLERPNEKWALLVASLEENRDILPLKELKPDYLLGHVSALGVSAFSLWEHFRECCECIQLTTCRSDGEPQVLMWEKDPDNKIELSVIFPMYNVAKYLDQCIQSVTAWDADYIEFLFVNDGSPDNSREIVLEYAKKDPRIKLLDKPNGGCASARQWGLDHAKGRYVGFVDPDDYIDESMFRKLIRNAFIGNYDISYCGYKEYYENNGQTKDAVDVLGWPFNKGVTNPKQILILIAYCRIAIWRGIFKMEMLRQNNIHFYTELRRFDDLPFHMETLAAARSVISLDENLYYYRLARPGQDVSADDERLYVHFPIFAHLNDSIASKQNQELTDHLQLRKIQTHRYALEKIRPEFVKEYARQARADLATTGSFWRSFFMIKEMLGRKSALIYLAIMCRNTLMLKKLCGK